MLIYRQRSRAGFAGRDDDVRRGDVGYRQNYDKGCHRGDETVQDSNHMHRRAEGQRIGVKALSAVRHMLRT